jgi:hypothetical protein
MSAAVRAILGPGPKHVALPMTPVDAAYFVDSLATLLAHPNRKARATGVELLAVSLRVCRYPAGNMLASEVGSGGLVRIDLGEAARIVRDVPDAFATSDPARHAQARDTMRIALGEFMMSEPPDGSGAGQR